MSSSPYFAGWDLDWLGIFDLDCLRNHPRRKPSNTRPYPLHKSTE